MLVLLLSLATASACATASAHTTHSLSIPTTAAAAGAWSPKAWCTGLDNATPKIAAALSDANSGANVGLDQAQADLQTVALAMKALDQTAPKAIRADMDFYIADVTVSSYDAARPSYQVQKQQTKAHLDAWVQTNCGFPNPL